MKFVILVFFWFLVQLFNVTPNNAKMKYLRSFNGIVGKIDTTAPIDVSLSLVESFSTLVLFGFGL